MTKRFINNIQPLHKDKYYVYALFKPNDFNPFYVGKGIGERVNNHFKKSQLKVNTPKTAIIKKYGNSIRREILAYFDCEEDAYAFEEYLISLYGVAGEGGLLVNYAKTRFQYSEKFKSDICSIGAKSRENKYSEDTISMAYKLYFEDGLEKRYVSENCGLPLNYLPYLLRGLKRRSLFEKFKDENKHLDFSYRKKSLKIKHPKQRRVSNSEIVESFYKVLEGVSNFSEEVVRLGISEKYLESVFYGTSRTYLNLPYDQYKRKFGACRVNTNDARNLVYEHFKLGLSGDEIVKTTGLGRTTVFRHLKTIKNGMGVGKTGEGTSDSPMNSDDAGTGNMENA